MAQETFFDKVREFIGSIAWSIFLWSIRMSEDEYLDAVVRESGLTQRALDGAKSCRNCGGLIGVRSCTCDSAEPETPRK